MEGPSLVIAREEMSPAIVLVIFVLVVRSFLGKKACL